MESAIESAIKTHTKPPDLSSLVNTVDFAALENRFRELKLRVDSSLESIFVGQKNEVRLAIKSKASVHELQTIAESKADRNAFDELVRKLDLVEQMVHHLSADDVGDPSDEEEDVDNVIEISRLDGAMPR